MPQKKRGRQYITLTQRGAARITRITIWLVLALGISSIPILNTLGKLHPSLVGDASGPAGDLCIVSAALSAASLGEIFYFRNSRTFPLRAGEQVMVVLIFVIQLLVTVVGIIFYLYYVDIQPVARQPADVAIGVLSPRAARWLFATMLAVCVWTIYWTTDRDDSAPESEALELDQPAVEPTKGLDGTKE